MPKFRYINTAIWDDEWFQSLDALEQHLFIYFLTNTQTNITGVYQIALRRIAFDTGMDQEKVKKIIERFQGERKMFYELGWVVMKNWQRHQALNPNQAVAVATHLNSLPDWLKKRLADVKDPMFLDMVSVLNPFKAIETLGEPWQSVRTKLNAKLEVKNKTPNPNANGARAGGGGRRSAPAGGRLGKPVSEAEARRRWNLTDAEVEAGRKLGEIV